MITPIAAKTVIVVGSATVCPIACSRWLRRKRDPPRGRRPPPRPAEKHLEARHHPPKEGKEPLPADPRLNAEPAARDECAHDCRKVRAERAVAGAREDRERDAVLRAGVRVQ